MYKIEIELVCAETVKLNDAVQSQFNLAVNTITLLYEQVQTIPVKGLAKIRIDLFDQETDFKIYEPDEISAICHIEKSFDFNHYFAQPKLDSRKIILETLYGCIVEMCKQLAYNLEPFTQAYNKVKELNYVNRYIHGKLTFSKNRQHKAGIQIEVNEDVATISVLFTDKDEKPVKQVEILKTIPHYMFIYRVIHKGKWLDNETYRVSDKSGQVHFRVSLESGSSEVIFNHGRNSEKQLKEMLNGLTIN